MKKIHIANGASEKSNEVKNVSPDWSVIVARLSTPRIQPNERSYMMAGHVEGGIRGSKSGSRLTKTSLLMIDLDDKETSNLSWDELVDFMDFSFPYVWAAYTTRSYTGESVNFRIIVPFDEPLDALKHRSAVKYIKNLLPPAALEYFDNCSLSPEQPIFLACISEEGKPFHAASGGSVYFDPANMDLEDDADTYELMGLDDLDMMLIGAPLDLSTAEINNYLDALDPNTMSYGGDDGTFGWLNVGMAISHQFNGSDEGYKLWVKWSERNAEKHDPRIMPSKWKSFDQLPRGHRPTTFASIIAEVSKNGGMNNNSIESLIERSKAINSLEAYTEFRNEVKEIPTTLLSDDARAMVASAIADGFGKSVGLTRSDVRKAIRHELSKGDVSTERVSHNLPEWASNWCYLEKTNEFLHIPSTHTINREAFNARFNRHPEVQELETVASSYVLDICHMPTYADRMYWPGAAETFMHHGNEYVNSYNNLYSVKPREPESEEDFKAIETMLNHFSLLVAEDKEKQILLDWLAYVYRNPGERLNWTILLQGAEGAGKSYIQVLMSHLMGQNAKPLEPSSLESRFTSWGHGSVLTIVEEIKISGSSQYATMDRLKPFITNEIVQIEEKGRDPRIVPNFTNYLFLSNHKDAIPVKYGNRRFCIIYSSIQTNDDLVRAVGGAGNEEGYFKNLFEVTTERADVLAYYLGTMHQISDDFNPKGRAPITASFHEAVQLSMSESDNLFEDVLSACECEVINDDIVDTTWLSEVAASNGLETPKTRTIKPMMLAMNMKQMSKRVFIAKRNARHRVWYNPAKYSEDDVERIMRDFFNGQDVSPSTFEANPPPF